MIKLCRVDHRLLHGQVAFSWCHSLGADCILIANDAVAVDDIRIAAMRLAQPNGVKLVIKNMNDSIQALNSGVTDKYKLLIVIESIADAYRLANSCKIITSINLGGTKKQENTHQLGLAVHVNSQDCKELHDLIENGIEIEIRQVPDDKKVIVVKEDLE